MTPLYPPVEPYQQGLLDVGDGNDLYWECCGNPDGAPAVLLHGGPGSGCTPGMRQLFSPDLYRIVLFDQRGCGRSIPHASAPETDLSVNTTDHLIAHVEVLRKHLAIDKWLVYGQSWGSMLGLAYAERYPERVSHAILVGIATGRSSEIERLYAGLAASFPNAWKRLRELVPGAEGTHDLLVAYGRLLADPDPAIRQRTARRFSEWEWETSVTVPGTVPPPSWMDPAFQLARSRIVTHYFAHDCFVDDGALVRDAGCLAGIPAVIIRGELDPLAPLRSEELLAAAWPGSDLIIVQGAGHATADAGNREAIIAASRRFAEG